MAVRAYLIEENIARTKETYSYEYFFFLHELNIHFCDGDENKNNQTNRKRQSIMQKLVSCNTADTSTLVYH